MIDDAQLFGNYSRNYLRLETEKQSIIQDAVNKLQQVNLATTRGRVEASTIFANACSLLKGEPNSGSGGAQQTPEPTPTPVPTPVGQRPLPESTYPDGYSSMVNGQNLAEELLRYLVPQYNQSAKEYANLTGKNTFALIGAEPNGFEQFVSAVYKNSIQPIWQMIVEDWNGSIAAGKARYIAFRTDASPYHTFNFFLGGIPDTAVGIYKGFVQRGNALINDANVSTVLNVATMGLSGQFEIAFNTPMSDPNYWRAVRNITGAEMAVLMGYKGWNISQNPYSTEWMIRYGDRMGASAGVVPSGTFDEAFTHYDFAGTVWDSITPTAKNLPATEIPATFTIDLDMSIQYINPTTKTCSLWTNANATKHFSENILRFGEESWTIEIRSQALLESYSYAINEAMKDFSLLPPGRHFGIFGDWEIGINTETGVVYHALMK